MVDRTVLVVEDGNSRLDLVAALGDAGYRVTEASTFDEATELLQRVPPDILVTELRLGAYNGLHLILRCRMIAPRTRALVHTAYPDPVLEEEAEKLGVKVLIRPVSNTDLLGALSDLTVGPAERRAAKRKPVTKPVDVQIGNRPANLIDVSYTGFRIELRSDEIADVLDLWLPTAGVPAQARAVWIRRHSVDGGRLLCGATLSNPTKASENAWRSLIDSV